MKIKYQWTLQILYYTFVLFVYYQNLSAVVKEFVSLYPQSQGLAYRVLNK